MTIKPTDDITREVLVKLASELDTHKAVINELIDRIKVLEADRDRLHSWIMKDTWGWDDIDKVFEHESLSSTIVDEAHYGLTINGPVNGLTLDKS